MAAYTDSYGFDKGGSGLPAFGLHNVAVHEVVLDFAKIKAARAAAGVAALAAADTLDIMTIPKGTLADRVGYELVTPEGATFTFDLGDGDSATAWFSNANGNTTAGTLACSGLALTEGAPNTITGNSGGKFYTADGVLRMTLDHNSVDTAVIRVFARLTRFK